MKFPWSTGLSSRVVGTVRLEWREWLWGDYVISTCFGNEVSTAQPSKLGVRRTRLSNATVFVVEHRGKFLDDCSSLKDAEELVEAHRDLEEAGV